MQRRWAITSEELVGPTNVSMNEKGVAQSLLHVNHVNHVFEDARSSRPTLRATRPTFPLVKVSKRYCF